MLWPRRVVSRSRGDTVTDERNAPQGFRKYGTPVPVRKGDAPPSDAEQDKIPVPQPRKDDGEGSRVPTGS